MFDSPAVGFSSPSLLAISLPNPSLQLLCLPVSFDSAWYQLSFPLTFSPGVVLAGQVVCVASVTPACTLMT
jgi:hypothetical protein